MDPGVPGSVTHVANEKLMPMMLNDMSKVTERQSCTSVSPHQPAQQQLLGLALPHSLEVNAFLVSTHINLTSLYN